MRHYELCILVHPDQSEQVPAMIERLKTLVAEQNGKIERVEAWLEAMGLWWNAFEESWFYSDSLNDLPLLSKVSHPIAVDPDATLRAHAEAQGWTVLNLHL